jgi:putative transposase
MSKHSEAQIIAALKQVEAGRTAEDVARECGVSKHTIYAWKAKFGGMEASEAQRLRNTIGGSRTIEMSLHIVY